MKKNMKKTRVRDALTPYDYDENDEGCVRLYVNTDVPYSVDEGERLSRLIDATPSLLAVVEQFSAINWHLKLNPSEPVEVSPDEWVSARKAAENVLAKIRSSNSNTPVMKLITLCENALLSLDRLAADPHDPNAQKEAKRVVGRAASDLAQLRQVLMVIEDKGAVVQIVRHFERFGFGVERRKGH